MSQRDHTEAGVAVAGVGAGVGAVLPRAPDAVSAVSEDEEALRRHPAGKRRRELSHDETWQGGHGGRGDPGTVGFPSERETAALPPLEPTSVIPPGESDTAWTRRMGLELEAWTAAKLAETDEWLREMTR